MSLTIDYLDADVAYLLGLLVARGELLTKDNTYYAIVHFPKGSLLAQGINTHFDSDREIRLGIEKIRERLMELLGADIRTADAGDTWDLVARFTRNTMAWRNINMLLGNKTSFSSFDIPQVFLDKETPIEFKREFIKGFADVAGNIRPANRDQAGRHRLRLDILNYPTNWHLAMKLCLLLQNHLNVPVPVLTWGHPDLGRQWREHQLNVYAEEFLAIGFYFDFKQAVLEELAKFNCKHFPNKVKGCPGARGLGRKKKKDPEEKNAEKLPAELLGKHFNSYWQICRALGCTRRPAPREQLELLIED
jgi:hypothetical protein